MGETMVPTIATHRQKQIPPKNFAPNCIVRQGLVVLPQRFSTGPKVTNTPPQSKAPQMLDHVAKAMHNMTLDRALNVLDHKTAMPQDFNAL
eukprot:5904659-Amphidinium_carterae.1